jgi:hypothetical protein
MKTCTRSELRQVAQAAEGRSEAAGGEDPFATTAWWLTFIDHVCQDRWNYTAPAAGGGLSLLPFFEVKSGSRVWHALTNFYTGRLSLPVPEGAPAGGEAQRAMMEAVLAAMGGLRPAPTQVELSPLSAADAALVQQAWRALGWLTRVQPAFGNWYLPCAGLSFEQFMKDRPARLQNTWHRKRRPFEAGLGNRLQIVREVQQVDAAMGAFETVYARSWKPAEASPAFIRAWAMQCARLGWLRLGLAWFDGRPVAAQFWFTAYGKAHVFKLAYDGEYGRLSAGTVLSAHMFHESLEIDRVREIDYLSGDDDYKRDWMTHRRQRFSVTACNPRTPAGLLCGLRHRLAVYRDRWVGQGLPPAPDGNNALEPSTRQHGVEEVARHA